MYALPVFPTLNRDREALRGVPHPSRKLCRRSRFLQCLVIKEELFGKVDLTGVVPDELFKVEFHESVFDLTKQASLLSEALSYGSFNVL
jgi:hypothetical protein